VAKCQAAGQVCLNKACVPDACDNEKALSPRCRAICHLMAPSLAYACSECEGKVVCTRDNVLPMLGAINKRRPWRMLQSRKRNAGVQSSAA
jgi:hypothetical protein